MYKSNSMKFLEETLSVCLLNFNLGWSFLNNSLKAQTTKENIVKVHSKKKSVCVIKDTTDRRDDKEYHKVYEQKKLQKSKV